MATSATNILPGSSPVSYAEQHPGGVNEAARRFGETAVGHAGSMGPYSRGGKSLAPGGQDVEVLLGVNTWEHVWLRDYGIGGKRDYLERWWDAVDWGVVAGRQDEGRRGLGSLGDYGRGRVSVPSRRI